MSDVINHPEHYTSGNIEVIDYIEDKEFNFNLGNVIKYVSRAGLKKSVGKSAEDKALEDLRKAQFYIQREIERREKISVYIAAENYLKEATTVEIN